MGGVGILRGLVVTLMLATASIGVAADRDFSDGLTGMGAMPVAGGASSPEWEAQQKAAEQAANAALSAPATTSGVAPGQVGPGDKIKLTVFGEEDLSGEFEIDSTGSLALPLVGEVPASGLTPRELERKITKTLETGYLVNPRVNIEVMNFRPFFILGEVNKPGSYPYVNGLTVINAVATAGGYTPRAKTGKVMLRSATDASRAENWVSEDTKVFPGDVIRVDERFF